jgi:WD40 repeat protein
MLTTRREGVKGIALSPDGKLLAAVTNNIGSEPLALYDVDTGRQVARSDTSDIFPKAVSVAFLTGGKKLVCGTEDGRLLVWDVPGLQLRKTLQVGHGEISCLAAFPDGKSFASGHGNGIILVWNTAIVAGDN